MTYGYEMEVFVPAFLNSLRAGGRPNRLLRERGPILLHEWVLLRIRL